MLDFAPFTVKREKTQLVYEIILLNKILRNRRLSEHLHCMKLCITQC